MHNLAALEPIPASDRRALVPPIQRKVCETCHVTPVWRTDGATDWTAECLDCMRIRLWPHLRIKPCLGSFRCRTAPGA